METTQRQQTINKLSRIPNYSGGGLIDSLKRAVGLAPKQPPAAPSKQSAPGETIKISSGGVHPAIPAPMGNQTIIDKRMADAGLANGGKVKPGMAKAAMAGGIPAVGGKKKSDRGGMLKGPGTPTSDSIPAEVVDTGEPIKVATGERIVSKKQDAYLQQVAKEKGFPSVDAMLEAGTGEPVGPTLKYDDEMSRGAAGGASPDDLRRQLMVSQIPTGGAPDTGPTPQPNANMSASGTDLGRTTSNLSGALAPIAGGARLMMAAGKAVSTVGQSAMAARALDAGVKAAPYALPAAGAVGLSAAASNDPQQPPGAVQPTAVPPKAAPVAAANAVPTPAAPATVAATPSAAARLGGVDGVNVGNGVTRFNIPGKAPLFTNVTDAAGMASNERLISRDRDGIANMDNQRAMQGIQERQDAADTARARMAQYNAEVAGAKAINDGQEAMRIQRLALQGNRGAQAILAGNQTDATTRRGQDIIASGQAVQADAAKTNQRLAQDRLGIEKSQDARSASKDARETKQQDRLQAAYDAYEKDPNEDNAARVRVLTGKEKTPAPDLFDKIQTGVDPITNAPIYSLYNKRTGEMSGQQAKPQGQYETGKVYTDAKGNRAKWDGKAFVPA